jgi:hypothetical protein
MKKQLFLLGWLLFATPIAVEAQFDYTTNNGSITVTGYTGTDTAVVIPDTISGLPVTGIGFGTFHGCTNLTSITIPNGVTNIDWFAFEDLTSLTSVIIPNSVVSIGSNAFAGCSSLTNVTLPNSVINIGFGLFEGCTSLIAITVDAFNAVYSSVDGALFDKNRTTLWQYPGGKAGSYSVPSSVTRMWPLAFSGCTNLTSITIPQGITGIEGGVFENCTSLTSITIPNSVTSIGYGAFLGCTNLASITIPNSVTSIGDFAFEDDKSLTSLALPNSLTKIGANPFAGCTSLVAITVNAFNSNYSSVDGVLFNKNQTMLIAYPPGKKGSYSIPNTVTSIGSEAFYGCPNLTNVTIPDSVTNIESSAFNQCTGLTSVTIPESVTSIGEHAFAYCTRLDQVYFRGNQPNGNLPGVDDETPVFDGIVPTLYYLPGASGWGQRFGGSGSPTGLWVLPTPVILNSGSFGVQTQGFGFTISWATNKSVVIEASTDLSKPTWMPLSTNTLVGGTSYFSDPQWADHPRRFYRVRAE